MKMFKLAHRILMFMAGIKGETVGNNQSKRIATAVIEFVNNHINREFTAQELRQFVLGKVDSVAPASADRIMRQLRKSGAINYELVSRVHSLYRGLDAGKTNFVMEGVLRGETKRQPNYDIETGKFRSNNPDTWDNPPHNAKYGETIN